MPGPWKLVGSGRHADVYDLGDGRVLRRYRDASAVADREAGVMVHAWSHGVPVPEVFDVSGAAATAVAPTIVSFGLCQLCAQAFLALEGTLTWTVIAEELPARARGFGFGVLAMLDALGAGTGALVWGLLLSPHHLSWRWLCGIRPRDLRAGALAPPQCSCP
jgi:hypothetical protein